MAKLIWDQISERLFETGISKAVLFVLNATGNYGNGIAWNGFRSVEESPEGAEPTDLYADNGKYLTMRSTEKFKATIGAYMSPAEFDECDGSASIGNGVTIGQQTRKGFGLAYQTILGNDTEGNDHAYIIHLVYGCTASPSGRSYESVNDSPAAMELSWEVDTTPVEVPGYKSTAHMKIRSDKLAPSKLKALEDIIYGTDSTPSRLPMPNEVLSIINGPDQSYTVTLNKEGNGKIMIDGNEVSESSVSLTEGNHTINAEPEEGYHLVSAKVGDIDISLPYVFRLTEAMAFSITFAADTVYKGYND